jgi:hypothetical protein
MITKLNIDAGASELAIRDWNRYPLANPYVEMSLGAIKDGSIKINVEPQIETLADGTAYQNGVLVSGECELLESDLTTTASLEGYMARNVDLVIYNQGSRKVYTLVDSSVVIGHSKVFTRKNANTIKVTFKAEAKTMSEMFAQNAYMPDTSGNYNEMVWIPKFLFDPATGLIGSGSVHPAFIVNGVEKDGFYFGKYQASQPASVARSLAGQIPKVSLDFDAARALAVALNGGTVSGWHLASNAEYAAISLLSKAMGKTVSGNNAYGKDTASMVAGKILTGDTYGSGTSRWLTGSGGRMTAHDNTPGGICDINGNVWEWTDGLKITDGIVSASGNLNTGATAFGNSFGATEVNWYNGGSAINITTGLTSGQPIQAMRTDALGSLCLPSALGTPNFGGDAFWFTASGERLPFRGGSWGNGSDAGLFALVLDSSRTSVGTPIGFRLALIL